MTSNDAIYLIPGQSVTLTHTANHGAGIYYPYLSGTEGGTIRVTSDTGFYADILLRGSGSSSAWADGSNKGDPEIVYLKAGEQTITLTNIGSSDAIVQTTRFGTTYPFTTNDLWLGQMAMKALKVVPYVAEPEPTPDIPSITPGTTSYTADLAGVYEVSSDKDVTVSTEIGSTATLAAGETGYIYLLKGVNTLGVSDDTATLTITALENNGLAYLDQVTANIPLAASSISELTLSGNFTNAQGSYTDYGAASGVAIGPNGSVDVTVTAPAAGLYVTQIQFVYDTQAQMTVESDTGFYGVINQQVGRVGWNELYQGEHGVGNQDMEIIFLRAGANTITFKNTGAGDTLITKIKMAKTGSLATLEAYNWQLNVENLKPVSPIVDSFINDAAAIVSGSDITLSGRVGAEYMDLEYGVEFATNKTGTRAQRYYGAKDGDIVAADETATATTTFTFGDWDGTFEIILKGVSTGEKAYKFFVGDNYTEEATVTVE